jgi:hypothetical protein
MAKHKVYTERELYPDPEPPKDYVHDPKWGIEWLRRASKAWFLGLPLAARLIATGEEVTILGWRRTWWGPSLRLQFQDGRIESGYDQATVEL